jgi:hypothetical protein
MNSKEFVANALKTESNDFDSIRDRLSNDKVLSAVSSLVDDICYYSQQLDFLKKYIFYGKPLPEGFFYSFNFKEFGTAATSEKLIRLFHASIGKTTEDAEFMEPIVQSLLNGKELDDVNLLEELHDGHWYDAVALDALGKDNFEDGMEIIINKLKSRYGDKFSENSAINRNLEVERAILENKG